MEEKVHSMLYICELLKIVVSLFLFKVEQCGIGRPIWSRLPGRLDTATAERAEARLAEECFPRRIFVGLSNPCHEQMGHSLWASTVATCMPRVGPSARTGLRSVFFWQISRRSV